MLDDHVAGGTGQGALAGALDVDPVAVGDLHDRQAQGRVHFPPGAAVLDEHHLRH
jgi:hypothetical protein